MIKAAIKSVVSHLTIVHVLRGSGCVGDGVTTGFAQRGYLSCYYFQLWKQSEFCRTVFIEQKKRQQCWLPHLCILFSVNSSVCSTWIHYGALLLFVFFQSVFSQWESWFFFFSVYSNKLPTKTNTKYTHILKISYFFLSERALTMKYLTEHFTVCAFAQIKIAEDNEMQIKISNHAVSQKHSQVI